MPFFFVTSPAKPLRPFAVTRTGFREFGSYPATPTPPPHHHESLFSPTKLFLTSCPRNIFLHHRLLPPHPLHTSSISTMPPRPPKKHLFPRHGCVFCRSTIYKRYNFNTHLDTHLVEVTENSNNIAALEDGNHFVPLIAAVRRRSQRHIAGIPELRPSEFDGCHSWKLFTLIVNSQFFTRSFYIPR